MYRHTSGEGDGDGSVEDVVNVGACDRDAGPNFCELYNTPPAKVMSTIKELGIGIFSEIDKESRNYVYEFENGNIYEF